MSEPSDAPTTDSPTSAPADIRRTVELPEPHLGWLVAGVSAAAAAIHFAMIPAHAGNGLAEPIGFALAAWFQLGITAAILSGRDGKGVYGSAAFGNLALIGLWVWSRTVGLPIGAHPNIAEEVGALDAVCVGLEAAAVLGAVRVLLARERIAIGRLAPAVLAVGALGLATTVITSPDAAEHSHSEAADPMRERMDEVDSTRCDTDLNSASYWAEAKTLKIDTYQGGAMDMTGGASAAGGHSHGAAAASTDTTTTTAPDRLEGRGSEDLDELIGMTSSASSGEAGAARLVSALGKVGDGTYDDWLAWLVRSGTIGGAHAHSTGSEDGGGHGGHVGPQPWEAMTNKSQCDKLRAELQRSRQVALAHPTAQDAMDDGWSRVTPYVPGIAAHYMNFDLVDGKFEIEKPEMMLYDGDGPNAHIVGLSYFINLEGTTEPSQGFTGNNDHYHRHVGLCIGSTGVIGDSQTTPEECEARGGVKADGSKGWMNHAWVVPGCESPWGVFSAASPILDSSLSDASGSSDKSCGASGVRDRYDMDPAPKLVTDQQATPLTTRGK